MKKLLATLARFGGIIARFVSLNDLHAYAGIALIAYGLNMFAPGAGWAAAGVLLFWLGIHR